MSSPAQVEIARISVPPLLTANDLARLLKVSPTTAYRLMQSGRIATIRLGKSVRVTVNALEEFIQRETVPAAKENGR